MKTHLYRPRTLPAPILRYKRKIREIIAVKIKAPVETEQWAHLSAWVGSSPERPVESSEVSTTGGGFGGAGALRQWRTTPRNFDSACEAPRHGSQRMERVGVGCCSQSQAVHDSGGARRGVNGRVPGLSSPAGAQLLRCGREPRRALVSERIDGTIESSSSQDSVCFHRVHDCFQPTVCAWG